MKTYPLLFGLLLGSILSNAQFTVGSDGLFIRSGTEVFIDSLTLQPSADLTIADNGLSVGYEPIPGSPAGSIERVYYWDAPVTFAGEAGIYYLPAELNGNDPSLLDVQISPTMDGSFTPGGSGSTSGNYVASVFSAGSVMQRITAASGTALPVRMIAFMAEKYETHHALLQWATAAEENVHQFEIEHSADGYLFAQIGTVPARNRSDEQEYRFIDRAKRTGIHYYRLASRDLDGTVSRTDIRAVAFDSDVAFKVFPNPTAQRVTVSGIAQGAALRIVSMTGKTVFSGRAADADGMTVDVGNLAAGVYAVHVDDGESGRLVINR